MNQLAVRTEPDRIKEKDIDSLINQLLSSPDDCRVLNKTPAALVKIKDLNSLIDQFLIYQDVSEPSKQTYKRQLRQFIAWINREKIQNPQREDILKYKQDLLSGGLSPLTVSGYIIAVKKFFSWGQGQGYCHDIGKGIKGAKRLNGFRKDPLTVDQVKELLNSLNRTTLKSKRDFALLNLLIRTGLRTVEIIRADLADIRQQSGEAVLWIQGKGRAAKDEFVLLTDQTLTPINDYLKARGKTKDNDPLFASLSDRNKNQRLTTRTIRGIVKENLRGIGLNSGRLTAHSLRHTSITLALTGGASIQEAQALGRHKDINTTLIYAHNINRIANAPERRIDELLAS